MDRAAESNLILVVDDDRDIRETLTDVLQDEGFKVVSAANGRDALSYLRGSTRPCLILLDLMMPVMDGWAFRHFQSEDPSLREIPVVVLSAAPEAEGALGAIPVLRKPVSFDNLVGTISQYC
jgi:CheY-like chemotaxis protein